MVAFVGGGGKTSLLFALAESLPGRVVITTTTRIFAAQMRLAPAVVYADDLSRLGELLDAHGRCLVVGHVDGDKARGVAPDLPARLLARPDVDAVVVEADGSRMRPVKAPAEHEPVIPPETTLVVPVAGLDALEGPLAEVAHRAEIVKRIRNYELGIRNEEQESVPSPLGRGLGEAPPSPSGRVGGLTLREEWLTPRGPGAAVDPSRRRTEGRAPRGAGGGVPEQGGERGAAGRSAGRGAADAGRAAGGSRCARRGANGRAGARGVAAGDGRCTGRRRVAAHGTQQDAAALGRVDRTGPDAGQCARFGRQ
ncbi:MAG: putative selenium-dependent hydroxylase accessory protein YqeC [Candidatus Promineofilum sp.]|nr:putative selenium-dependent hydroxylase accessory protein YqeC [Promineifilum sp.]